MTTRRDFLKGLGAVAGWLACGAPGVEELVKPKELKATVANRSMIMLDNFSIRKDAVISKAHVRLPYTTIWHHPKDLIDAPIRPGALLDVGPEGRLVPGTTESFCAIIIEVQDENVELAFDGYSCY